MKPEKDHIVKNHPHKVRLTIVLAANLTMQSVLALIIKFMAYEGPMSISYQNCNYGGRCGWPLTVGEMQVSNANDGRCLLRLDMYDIR